MRHHRCKPSTEAGSSPTSVAVVGAAVVSTRPRPSGARAAAAAACAPRSAASADRAPVTGPAPPRRRRFWGWGWEDGGTSPAQQQAIAALLAARFGLDDLTVAPAPRIDDLRLAAPRLTPPAALASICSSAPYD